MISDETRAKIRRLYYAERWKIGTISTELGLHRMPSAWRSRRGGFAARGCKPARCRSIRTAISCAPPWSNIQDCAPHGCSR
jgi:hypothetical protein